MYKVYVYKRKDPMYKVYMYIERTNHILWLSDADTFDEAYHHCELYSSKHSNNKPGDHKDFLIYDVGLDSWFMFGRDGVITVA